MVDEVASLGLKVDFKQITSAEKALDRLAKTAIKTAKATDALNKSSKTAISAIRAGATAAGRAAKATDALGVSTAKTTSALMTEGATVGRTAKATDLLSTSSLKAAKSTDALGFSSKKATVALTTEGVAAARTAKSTDALGVSTAKATTTTKGLTTAVSGLKSVFGAFAGLLIVTQLKNFSDEAISVNNRLKQVTTGTRDLNKTFDDLLDISNRTRSSLSSTSTLYQRLSIASGELGLSTKELLRLTETINKSFAISGATAEETSGAVRQLSQGLAAGALRGDEFNSVAEQAPAIMRAIADETELTIGQLREFAATGGITAEIVVSALQNVEEEIDEKFSRSIATFSQKITIIENDFIAWARSADDLSLSLGLLSDSIGAGAEVVKFFLSNIDLIVAVILARQIPAIQKLIATRAQSVVASQKALSAELATAKATQTTTLLELEKAVAIRASTLADLAAEQVRLKAQISITGRNLSLARTIELSKANAGATALLTRASNASSLAIQRAAAAQTNYNIATRAGTAVTSGLKNALAFLGGPGGVAVLATFAIFQYINSIETAEEKTIRLIAATDELSLTLQKLSKEEATVRIFEVEREIKDLKLLKSATATAFRIAKAFADQLGDTASLEKLAKARLKLKKVTDALSDADLNLINLNKILNGTFEDGLKNLGETNKLTTEQTKAITSSVEKYRDLLSIVGRTAREQAIYNDIVSKGIDINSTAGQSIKLLIDEYFNQVEAIKATEKANKDLAKEIKEGAKEIAKVTKKAAKDIERAYRKAFETTSDIIFDSLRDWEGGFKGFADRVGDIVKDLLARIAAEFAASKVLQFLGIGGGISGGVGLLGSLFGTGGGLGAGAGGGGIGDIFSLLSGGKSLFGIGAAAAGTGGTILGGGVGGGLIIDLGPTASGFTVAVDSLATSITSGAPIFSALAGALEGFEVSGVKGAIAGGAGGFFGAKAGAALGTAILPGIGTAIGAVLGGLLGGKLGAAIFGGEFKTKDFGLQLSVAVGDLVAESFERQKKKGGLFSSTKRRTLVSDLEEGVAAEFDNVFETIQSNIIDSYAALGVELGEEVFDSFSSAVTKISTKGKTEEEINLAVAEFFGNVADEMVSSIEGTGSDFQDVIAAIRSGGGLFNFGNLFDFIGDQLGEVNTLTFERLTELASILSTTNDVLSAIGVSGFAASFAGAEGAEKLIEFFGGAEQFVIAAASFEDAFIDKGSIIDQATEQLTAVFDSLGFSIPATRQGFADLVQGLDVTTESGVEAFGILTSLSELLSAFYGELEKLELEREARDLRIAQQRVQLEIQELQLLGDAAGALAIQRAIELDAMDESLRPLQERIFSLQDEQTAADAAATAASAAADEVARLADQANEFAAALSASTDLAFSALKTSLSSARAAINESLASQLAQADAAFNSTSASISRSIDGMRTSASGLRSVVSGIDRAISNLTGGLTQGQAQAQIQAALTQARGGAFDFGPDFASALTTVSNISEESFATAAEFRRATATTANQLSELRTLTAAELTLEERTVAALEARLVATRRQHEATINQLRANAASQIAGLSIIESDFLELIEIQRGTFQATLSVADAINNLSAILGLEQANAPSFANGGAPSGNLSLVGAQTPGLEFTGPINTAGNTGGNDVNAVQAMQNLTAEVKVGNFTLGLTAKKISKLLDRWDKIGIPPERAVL